MSARRANGGLPALGLAVGGVLAGHWLTYLVVRPEHHGRAELLASTGHAYLGVAVEAGVLVVLVAAAGAFLGRLTGGGERTPRFRSLTTGLWGFQLVAFLLLETAERAVAGSFEGLVAVAVVGAVMQLIVAIGTAWLLGLILTVADLAAGMPVAWRPSAPLVARILAGSALPHRSLALLRAGIRGPPSGR